jgi:hypothetical protein
MSTIVGPLEAVNIGGREFEVASDADISRALGGKENTILPNGGGGARQQKVAKPWSLSGLQVVVDDSRDDHAYLQEIADAPGWTECAATFASGITFSGSGTIVGEFTYSSTNGTASLDLSGPNKLERQ